MRLKVKSEVWAKLEVLIRVFPRDPGATSSQ